MPATFELGELVVDVEFKDVKNVHLSVYPPDGKVRVTAPRHMRLEVIRFYAISKLAWIKRERARICGANRESPREFLNRESHYVWGNRYLMEVVERDAPPMVTLKHKTLVLQVRPGCDVAKKQAVLAQWHRGLVREAAARLIETWEPRIGVKVRRCYVQQMKTRWGSCNPRSGNIRLNTELARKNPKCLDYIVVHEMIHLLEPTHNARFQEIMNQMMPLWEHYRDTLNQAPLAHVDWTY